MLWIAPSKKATANAALVFSLSASDGERVGVRCSPSVADQFHANPGLKSQEYSAPILGLEAKLRLTAASEGEKTHRSVDLLGRVYEYFLTRFASAEGKNGGQFYTPSCVVRCLVECSPLTRAASLTPPAVIFALH